jgi:hypothetical protein
MPRDPKTGKDPNSHESRVTRWYQDHPGTHRCKDVAPELGLTTHQVAVACWFAAQHGTLDKTEIHAPGRAKPFSAYTADTVSRKEPIPA